MTVNEAIENVKYHQEWRLGADTEMLHPKVLTESINMLLEENNRLNARLKDKLPNGGFRVHGIKNSMQPTYENDTE